MDEDEFFQKASDVKMEDVDNIISKKDNRDLSILQTNTLHMPKEKEFAPIDISHLFKIKQECEKAKGERFPKAEFCLGLSTLLFGAVLGAIMSKVPYTFSVLSIFAYTIFPVVGIIFLAIYWLNRKKNIYNVRELAEKVLDNISDSIEEDEDNESK